VLARAGFGSRRACEELIAAGFESAGIGALQNVFCERWIADAMGNEAEEFSAKIEQCVE